MAGMTSERKTFPELVSFAEKSHFIQTSAECGLNPLAC
jgi:hypothetical protein